MWQAQLALQPICMMAIACLLMLIIHMIQDMHRSANQAYPLNFLCSSPVLPSFKHTWHCTADTVVMATWQHFITHDTVRFLVNMILSCFCKHDTATFFKHDTARFCFFYRRRLQTEEACLMFPDDCHQPHFDKGRKMR